MKDPIGSYFDWLEDQGNVTLIFLTIAGLCAIVVGCALVISVLVSL